MPVAHPDMLATIAEALGWLACNRLGRGQLALIASLYKSYRPNKSAYQTAKILAAIDVINWPGPAAQKLKTVVQLVDLLDEGYWCAMFEHDGAS